MYGSESTRARLPYICLLFSSFVCHSMCVWPTALKLGCVTNFDMLFLVMGFISLVDEIQFMLIGSRLICIRSIVSLLLFGCELCVMYRKTENGSNRRVQQMCQGLYDCKGIPFCWAFLSRIWDIWSSSPVSGSTRQITKQVYQDASFPN